MTFDQIKDMLVEGVCDVSFTKLDGTPRVMRCTIKESLIPADKFPKNRNEDAIKTPDTNKPKTNVLAVWDLEKGDWRSFRMDRVDNIVKVVE